MIEVSNLSKHYGDHRVLDDVEFVARDGSITGLIGPNGAGKTTTFRIISGLLAAGDGRVTIDDLNVADPLSVRRRLGILPPVHGLYGRLTAREHIRYFGALHGLTRPRIDARVEALLGLLGLHEVADRRAHGFSQGERVKVALACALVHEPRSLVLDEPTAGLDVMTVRALHALLRSLRAAGACILFSSHVMEELASLCDCIVILSRGRVIARGAPEELLRLHGRPSLEDLFVALVETGTARGSAS